MTTNWLRALILDDQHVIDYVQFCGPIDATNITATINDPPSSGAPTYYLWTTNAFGNGPTPSWGYVNQIAVSRGEANPPASAQWNNPSLPSIPGMSTVQAAEAFLNSMFEPSSSFSYNGITYSNNESVVPAGYSAVRTTFVGYLFQVNDPLVHYLASDLNTGPSAVWENNQQVPSGVWHQNNGVVSIQIPAPPTAGSIIKGRYQPWGLMQTNGFALSGTDAVLPNQYDLALKDPLVWGPDYWDFPTNLLSDLSELGQVHRGTPWETVYLKASDVLNTLDPSGDASSGTNTWVVWNGDGNVADAAVMSPVADRQLVSLLIPLLNTNDPTQLVSVNDTNSSDWLNLLNGLTVYSNSANFPIFSVPPGVILQTAFGTLQMASNSPQATIIANGISQARAAQPNDQFYSIGDILSALDLTEDSPWLNTTNINQQKYGVSDTAYEAIPAQLLLLLRPDSMGSVYLTNGGVNLQFSGSDALSYEVQQSSDLVHWTAISTNNPVHDVFNVLIPPSAASSQHFYRSLLLR